MELSHYTVQRSWFINAMLQSNGGAWPDLEALLNAVYADYVCPGDLVLDVGVNHGVHFVKLANLVGGAGRVIGIEAVPAFAEHARQLLRTEDGGFPSNVTLHTCAVAAEAGSAEFFVTKLTDGGLSGLRLRPVIAHDDFEKIIVRTTTIDALLPSDQQVRFVKIDIEGGEYDALRGSPTLLAQMPLIAFEFDSSAPDQFGFQPEELLELLWRAGYVVHDIFGFKVESAEAMMSALVWNFLAIPSAVDAFAITAPCRRVLESRFPRLAALKPTPPPSAELVEAILRSGGLSPAVTDSTGRGE